MVANPQRQLDFVTDSATASTFETLPLTPPPKPNARSHNRTSGAPDVPLPHPQRAFRSLSPSSFESSSVLSSPLRSSSGFTLEPRPVTMPVVSTRSPYAQTSPFSPAPARPGSAIASWPSFSREPPVLQITPHPRGEAAQLSLNRILSMERGEPFQKQQLPQTLGDRCTWHPPGRIVGLLVALRQIFRSGSRPTKKLLLLIVLNFTYSAIQFLIGLFTGRIGKIVR